MRLMKKAINIEFFTTTDGKEIIVNQDSDFFPLRKNDAFLELLKKRIYAQFPEAAKRLDENYNDDYAKVLRFCKCNFAIKDHIPDMSYDKFNIEFVPCPLRGECEDENVICNPKLRTGITVRETEIVRLIAEGKTLEQIAEQLFISPKTVTTHKKNIYSKLNVHTAAEITHWAYEHKII